MNTAKKVWLRFREFLTKTDWQWYKNFFHISFFRYLIIWFALVPIIAKFITELPTEVKFEWITYKFKFNFGMPFSWELLWISSLAFVIAFLTYYFVRPVFLNKYSSYSEYKKHGHSPRWVVWEAKEVVMDSSLVNKFTERVEIKGYLFEVSDFPDEVDMESGSDVIVQGGQSVLYYTHNNVKYMLGMPIVGVDGTEDEKLTAVAEREIFWEVFGRFSSSNSLARFIISSLLVVSFALVFYVLIQNIFNGFHYLYFA